MIGRWLAARAALVGALPTVALCGSAQAAELRVGANEAYQTVQSAVDASVSGDRVVITEGIYLEEVVVQGKDIELVGDGAPPVLMSPGPPGPAQSAVLLVDDAAVTVQNLVVDGDFERRGVELWNAATANMAGVDVLAGLNVDGLPGGNVRVADGSQLQLMAVALSLGTATVAPLALGGNLAVEAGGIAILGPEVLVEGGLAERGGGVHLAQDTTAKVAESQFLGNVADGVWDNDGGGICAETGSTLTVNTVVFDDNHAGMDADSAGGGLYAATDAVVHQSSFTNGTAHMGAAVAVEDHILLLTVADVAFQSGDKGAVACVGSPLCAVADSSLDLNGAELGAAVYGFGSDLELYDNLFCENQVDYGGLPGDNHGGAVAASQGSALVQGNVFAANSAVGDGGAIWASDLDLESVNNHYLANGAGGLGGALHAADLTGIGVQADSVNDLFLQNDALLDGGVHFAPGLLNTIRYGWFYANIPTNTNVVLDLGLNTTGLEPLLSGWTAMEPCSIDGMAPDPASGLIDGGDPTLTDVNGGPSDIGAFGGSALDDGGTLDSDGDGVIDFFDCNPVDPSIGLPTQWHPDIDGDSYGNEWVWTVACEPPLNWIDVGGDCNDLDPTVNPTLQWWPDDDGDGFGGAAASIFACEAPYGWVGNADDCNDSDPTLGAPTEWFFDEDGDGYGIDQTFLECYPPVDGADRAGDCAPQDASVNPGALESCNGVDDDCDGVVDNDADDAPTWYADADGDGFGDPEVALVDCEPGPGWVRDATDCDDTDGRVYPGGKEIWYDGVDGDCSGGSDFDQDRDGVERDEGDCDDTDPERFPGAEDALNDGVDSDCDGVDSRSWVAGGGCACDSGEGGSTSFGALGLLGLLGLRRRR